jgi:ABC-type amino acid transport substrate-binding protein
MNKLLKTTILFFTFFLLQNLMAERLNKIVFSGGAPLNTYQPSIIVPILTEAFKRNNIEFKATYQPSLRSLISSNSGDTDGELHRIYDFHKVSNNKYPNLIRIESELLSTRMIIYSKKNIVINSLNDLKKYSIGYYRGRKNVELLLSKLVPSQQIVKLTTDKQAFRMLSINRIDLVISENIEGKRIIKNNSNLSNIVGIYKVKESKIYSYINKKYSYLAPKIAKTIEQMKKDGTFSKIVDMVNKSL